MEKPLGWQVGFFSLSDELKVHTHFLIASFSTADKIMTVGSRKRLHDVRAAGRLPFLYEIRERSLLVPSSEDNFHFKESSWFYLLVVKYKLMLPCFASMSGENLTLTPWQTISAVGKYKKYIYKINIDGRCFFSGAWHTSYIAFNEILVRKLWVIQQMESKP